MFKIDSFVKESQRLHPLGAGKFTVQDPRPINLCSVLLPSSVMVLRKSLEECTLSNGTKVPPGIIIAVPSITHRDPEVFADPSKFDGFRFVKMKERAVMEGYPNKKFDMVTINTHSLNFGHGKTACPGRFLAASVIKTMIAYVVVTYDVKFVDGVRPPEWDMMHFCGPNRTAKVLFRKRRPSV